MANKDRNSRQGSPREDGMSAGSSSRPDQSSDRLNDRQSDDQSSRERSRESGHESGRESVSDRAGTGGYGASSGFSEQTSPGSDQMSDDSVGMRGRNPRRSDDEGMR